jgi:MoaA/NifB/PqqE/SkfB family radical SAM enzyme
MNTELEIVKRYKYSANYIPDYQEFYKRVRNKSVIPYQVEFQPPPASTTKICWLECPYCYGLSANDNGDRLPADRGIQIMRQIAEGGVKKVIFAGYATDPLNSPYLEDLLEIAIDHQMVFGFNTKALKVSDRLIALLSRDDIAPTSYMSISVDAGSNEVYNRIHGVTSQAPLYDRVLDNIRRVGEARKRHNLFDLSAAYLVNIHSHAEDEVLQFINDFKGAGCNLLRFTFPQPPRGINTEPGVVPTKQESRNYHASLAPVISAQSSDACPILLVDADTDHEIFHKPRTVPCFARFVYPTVGFDGWLYHCSQSSAPNFRPMALGNLNESDFWDLFYNYDADNLSSYFTACEKSMSETGCRCDRKEHILNSNVINSGVFNAETDGR